MKQEIWKPIKGYEGHYEVSNMGRVRSYKNNKYGLSTIPKDLKPTKMKIGYLFVTLSKDGKHKMKKIHRLVAEAFIPNPEGLPCVNHRDEVKTNNTISNLEWCTQKYNLEYSNIYEKAIGTNISQRKIILQLTKDGDFIREFESIIEAYRQTGVNYQNISACCNGKRKSAGGYVWKFK